MKLQLRDFQYVGDLEPVFFTPTGLPGSIISCSGWVGVTGADVSTVSGGFRVSPDEAGGWAAGTSGRWGVSGSCASVQYGERSIWESVGFPSPPLPLESWVSLDSMTATLSEVCQLASPLAIQRRTCHSVRPCEGLLWRDWQYKLTYAICGKYLNHIDYTLNKLPIHIWHISSRCNIWQVVAWNSRWWGCQIWSVGHLSAHSFNPGSFCLSQTREDLPKLV